MTAASLLAGFALLDVLAEPLAREHAAWALGRIGTESARAALREQAAVDADASVRAGIGSALPPNGGRGP